MTGNHKPQTFKNCLNCRKRFGPLNRLKMKFCSKKCHYTYRSKLPSPKKGKQYPHLWKMKQCILCLKNYHATSEYKSRQSKYCSKECWAHRNPPKPKRCLQCSTIFMTYEKGKVYCNQKCRDIHYRTRLKGANSNFWQGGKTALSKRIRTSAEYREWRNKVFKRDNYTCQDCGAKSQKGQRVTIEADHIKTFSKHPESRFDINNGKTRCHECHKATPTYGWKARWGFTGLKAEKI